MPKREKQERDSSFLAIDENQLDVEWLGQAELYYTYAAKLSDAIASMDEAKADFELTQAELAKDIREDPGKYDLGKVTDKSVEATVIMQKEYQEAQAAVNTAKHRVGVLKAAVDALDQRKKALEKLVELRLANYYSEPRARTEGAREEVDNIRKKSIRSGRRRGRDE
jgi:hypothetical protein